MKIALDCLPCLLRQSVDASRMAGADLNQQKRVAEYALDILSNIDFGKTPAEIGNLIHRYVREEIGNADPYREEKQNSTRRALEEYPRMKKIVQESDDPLEAAIRISIAGNMIDFGPKLKFDLSNLLEAYMDHPLSSTHLESLKYQLAHVDRVLYLADNAGETVFDRVLIEMIDIPVIYGVKGGPVLNDATEDDAVAAGLHHVTEIISTGSDAPGTILDLCSDEFKDIYQTSNLVIAKGQGNFETLSDEEPIVFFLLMAKCPVIAKRVGVDTGSPVIEQGARRHTFWNIIP